MWSAAAAVLLLMLLSHTAVYRSHSSDQTHHTRTSLLRTSMCRRYMHEKVSICHVRVCCVVWCRVVSCCVMLCHVMSCHVMSCHGASYVSQVYVRCTCTLHACNLSLCSSRIIKLMCDLCCIMRMLIPMRSCTCLQSTRQPPRLLCHTLLTISLTRHTHTCCNSDTTHIHHTHHTTTVPIRCHTRM